MYIEDFCYFYSYMPSSPLGIYKPLLKFKYLCNQKRVSDATRTLDTKVALMAGVAL